MGFNILGLMHPLMFDVAQIEPLWADLGGLVFNSDLSSITAQIRAQINETARIRKEISINDLNDFRVINGIAAEAFHNTVKVKPRVNLTLPFPQLPESYDAKPELARLRGLIDLDKVVVVTGYAEVGPWGSSRTRWQMEAQGELSIEGLLELAFVTGKFFRCACKPCLGESL